MSEVDKFFEGLPGESSQKQDIFDQNNPPKPAENAGAADLEKGANGSSKSEEDEGGDDVRKNRRHRRLEEQLRRERESNIALNERIRVLSEVNTTAGKAPVAGEMPAEWVALYGDSPESQKAWAMQERMFANMREQAKQEALQEFAEQQAAIATEQKEYESFIDSELEALEDEHGLDLTSNAPAARKARREFLEMLQQLSPKDELGNITAYADFDSTFEIYQRTKAAGKPADTTTPRAKEIAAKTMQESNRAPAGQQPTYTPGFRGWMKDFNLGG